MKMFKTVLGRSIGFLTVTGIVSTIIISIMKSKEKQWKLLSDKYLALFQMSIRWIEVKQEGKDLTDYLKGKGYRTVAIYGMGYMGERLYAELKNRMEVRYVIDKAADNIYSDLLVISPEEEMEPVDVIIVTAAKGFGDIKKQLTLKTECEIISLEEVLYEI